MFTRASARRSQQEAAQMESSTDLQAHTQGSPHTTPYVPGSFYTTSHAQGSTHTTPRAQGSLYQQQTTKTTEKTEKHQKTTEKANNQETSEKGEIYMSTTRESRSPLRPASFLKSPPPTPITYDDYILDDTSHEFQVIYTPVKVYSNQKDPSASHISHFGIQKDPSASHILHFGSPSAWSDKKPSAIPSYHVVPRSNRSNRSHGQRSHRSACSRNSYVHYDEEDASTIRSMESMEEMLIKPCADFTKYHYWLKKNFPGEIHHKEFHFVEQVLKIQDRNDVLKFSCLAPFEWRIELGDLLYKRYMNFLIELVIIWDATLHNAPTTISKYMKIKEQIFEDTSMAFYDVLNTPFVRVRPPTLSEPATPHAIPMPGARRQESPAVPSYTPRSGNLSTYRLGNQVPPRGPYKHSSPRPVDSIGIPLVEGYTTRENRSIASQRSRSAHVPPRRPHSFDEEAALAHLAELDAEGYGLILEQERDDRHFRKKPKREDGSGSVKSSASVSTSIQSDRRNRSNPAKIRPKFDKQNWDGMNTTFRIFKRALEGHLLQVGAGYLTNPTFLGIYLELKDECFKSDVFWKMFKIPVAQALYDRQYLYGILMSSTVYVQHKTILKHKES